MFLRLFFYLVGLFLDFFRVVFGLFEECFVDDFSGSVF